MVRAFSSATASVKWRANWRDAGTWSLSSTVTPRPRPAMIPPNTRPRPRSATRPARPTLLSSKATRHSTPAAGDTKRCPHGREAQALKRSAILEAELRSMLLPSTTAIVAAASVFHPTHDSQMAANQPVCGHEARRHLHLREPGEPGAAPGDHRGSQQQNQDGLARADRACNG